MKFLHISQRVANGIKVGPGITYDIGRNATKRAWRSAFPRKLWRTIPRY